MDRLEWIIDANVFQRLIMWHRTSLPTANESPRPPIVPTRFAVAPRADSLTSSNAFERGKNGHTDVSERRGKR